MSSALDMSSSVSEERSSSGWAPILARLAFVRGLPRVALAALVGVLALVRWVQSGGASELGAWLGERAPEAGAGTRHALWTAAAFLVLPLCVARATISFQRWRAGELDFLAPRAAPRFGIVVATWIGHAGALAAALCVVALFAELGTPSDATWLDRGPVRLVASGEAHAPNSSADGTWVRGSAPWSAQLALPEGSPARRVSVEFALGAGGGPATEIELAARRLPPAVADPCTRRERLGTRGVLEFELPQGGGPIELELSLVDPNARLWLVPASARAWSLDVTQRSGSAELFLRLWLVGAALSAFTLAASAFVSSAIAMWGALALWLAPGIARDAPAWWPGADLDIALDVLARGRVPAAMPLASVLVALVFVAAVLAVPGCVQAPWRRSR